MENGKWKMENGKWKMENGKWKMENRRSYLFFKLIEYISGSELSVSKRRRVKSGYNVEKKWVCSY
jgi:hypothetical protein